MISPGLGIKGMKEAVIRTVYEAGGKPCPPIILGVGIGGGADIALKLGKMALLRPINKRHKEREVAELEEELLERLNTLGIGPMGLGGDTTVLGVNIEYAHRHPATLPIAIVTQCWAARRATIKITREGDIEMISHKINLEEVEL
jgi:fumarate hydratase subunit alpha